MKKIIVLLVFGLSMIGCERERCKTCTTIMNMPGYEMEVIIEEVCDGHLQSGIIFYSTLGPDLQYFISTDCQ